ncbi:MAG: hypothetical protein AAFR41_12160, partial [Pseudomonadota bacterium]
HIHWLRGQSRKGVWCCHGQRLSPASTQHTLSHFVGKTLDASAIRAKSGVAALPPADTRPGRR